MDENNYQENEDVEAAAATSAADSADSAKDVVGIRFRNSGKTYCFSARGLDLRRGDRVVVESDLGINIGQVVKARADLQEPGQELKPVLRKVTEVDIKQEEENEAAKREARDFATERITARNLPMKLLYTDVTLDRKRFIFYFVADTRIDFRELVKDLASKFRTRIELRQIGVRDAAKMIGGFGICGQELCCKTWLKGFAPISIKMAKQQDLVLNTCKLSGLCGRLMCCLNYEYDPEGPRRRKKDVVAEDKDKVAAGEAREAAIESAIDSRYEGKAEPASRSGRQRPPRQAQEPASAGAGEPEGQAAPRAEGDQGDEAAKKKKRRRGGRRRKKQDKKTGDATGEQRDQARQEAPKGGQQKQGPQSGGGDAATAKAPEADQKDAEKPKRSRRRRWRPRRKKEGGGDGQQ